PGGRVRGGLRRAPAGEPVVRPAACHPPEPGLLRDVPRGLRQEPQHVQPGGHQVSGSLRLGCLLLLAVGLGACAAAPPPAPPPTAAPAPPPVVAPPPGLPPSALDALVAGHRERAATAEQAGRLRAALDEWKIALTLAPRDAQALEGRRRVEAKIEQGVGDQIEARRRFLAALALDPASAAAFQALQSEVKEVRFVNYTVKQGDTLGAIADRYYGDRSRSEVIWETNQLPPNPRLSAGTVLK